MDQSLRLENVKKICVLRTGGLGDLIVSLPAFLAIRQTYPMAEIVLLGTPWQTDFFVPGRTAIDRVVRVPALQGIRAAGTGDDIDEATFFRQMQREQFDIAISFQGRGIAANPFLRRLGARLTVGVSAREAEPVDRSLPYYYYQHETLRCLEIVKLIGAATSAIEPCLNVLAEDEAQASKLSLSLSARPFILLNPIARDCRRMWPLGNYVPLVEVLTEKNIDVAISGAPEDREVVETLIARITHPVQNLCGISFGALAALARKAIMFISPDTGPLHLARAVNCPSVGIYWAPNLINWGGLTRTIHRPVISWKLECPLCGIIPNSPHPFEPSTVCRHQVSFVSNITPAEVLHTVVELLGERKHDNNTPGEEEYSINEID